MKVAIVAQPIEGVLPPGQTSIGIWTYEAAPRLARFAGTEVLTYSRRFRHSANGRSARIDGVTHRFIRTGPNRVWDKLGKVADRVLRNKRYPSYARAWFHGVYAVQVGLDVRRRKCDVVHVQNWTSLVPLIRLLNRRALVVLHMHCEWLSQLDRRQMRRRIARTDLVLGCSEHIADEMRRAFPDLAGKFAVLPNGVDPQRFTPAAPEGSADDEAEPIIVFVGRVSPEKGVHDLVTAMERIVARRPNVRLELIGPVGAMPADRIIGVSDDPEVVALAAWYSADSGDQLRQMMPPEVAARVEFTGPLPHGDVVERIQRCRVLVNPSYSESFGMSLIEAMACARPVVATRVGGMPTIVDDGHTGLLVDRADPAALADAVVELLDDPHRADEMGRNGRARVEARFSWEVIARTAHECYASTVRSR
jgi:glycosyltransferase involved in cell wall biosynthesis